MAAQRVLCAAAAVALVLGATACGERSEPKGPLSVYPVTVQGAGDAQTLLARAPRRIVPLSRGLAGILAALRRGGEVVGAGAHPAYTLSGPRLVRALTDLRPDLLVVPSTFSPDDVNRAADATGAAVYVFPDTTVHDVEQGYTQLGLLVDAPLAARRLVHRLEGERRAVAARVARDRPTRVFVDAGYGTTVGSRTLLGDLLRQARAVDVAGPNPGPAPFRAADVARLRPDLYLALTSAARDELTAGPFAALATAHPGRVATLDPELAQAGPEVDRALAHLARALHPDAYR